MRRLLRLLQCRSKTDGSKLSSIAARAARFRRRYRAWRGSPETFSRRWRAGCWNTGPGSHCRRRVVPLRLRAWILVLRDGRRGRRGQSAMAANLSNQRCEWERGIRTQTAGHSRPLALQELQAEWSCGATRSTWAGGLGHRHARCAASPRKSNLFQVGKVYRPLGRVPELIENRVFLNSQCAQLKFFANFRLGQSPRAGKRLGAGQLYRRAPLV